MFSQLPFGISREELTGFRTGKSTGHTRTPCHPYRKVAAWTVEYSCGRLAATMPAGQIWLCLMDQQDSRPIRLTSKSGGHLVRARAVKWMTNKFEQESQRGHARMFAGTEKCFNEISELFRATETQLSLEIAPHDASASINQIRQSEKRLSGSNQCRLLRATVYRKCPSTLTPSRRV
jgi:hypothetical protein